MTVITGPGSRWILEYLHQQHLPARTYPAVLMVQQLDLIPDGSEVIVVSPGPRDPGLMSGLRGMELAGRVTLRWVET